MSFNFQRLALCINVICIIDLVLQACFTPSMRIGTITSTLKRSLVVSLHAAGGLSLKGRNVSRVFGLKLLQINESQRLHILIPGPFILKSVVFSSV